MTNSDLSIKRNLVRKKIIPKLESIYPGCSERINNFSQKMNSFNDERNDLIELAYLSCKDKKGLKRSVLNELCPDARSSIINRYLKEICSKQLSSKNLSYLAFSIFKKENGKIDLPEGFQIIWNKNLIDYKQNKMLL